MPTRKTFTLLDLSAATSTLLIRQYYSEQGDMHRFVVRRDIPSKDMVSLVVYVEGEVEIFREGSPDIIRRTEKAGNTSNESVWTTASKGVTFHRVVSDTYRYYCITDHKLRKFKSRTVRFSESADQVVAPRYLAFVAMGNVVVNGKTLKAPAIFRAKENPVPITGTPDTVVMEIEDLP